MQIYEIFLTYASVFKTNFKKINKNFLLYIFVFHLFFVYLQHIKIRNHNEELRNIF